MYRLGERGRVQLQLSSSGIELEKERVSASFHITSTQYTHTPVHEDRSTEAQTCPSLSGIRTDCIYSIQRLLMDACTLYCIINQLLSISWLDFHHSPSIHVLVFVSPSSSSSSSHQPPCPPNPSTIQSSVTTSSSVYHTQHPTPHSLSQLVNLYALCPSRIIDCER